VLKMSMRMLKNLLKKLPPNIYYNILTSHDVLQGTIWRRTAPAVDDAAFREKYKTLFVVGCGRSGTTIFSHCLGKHRDVVELNEPLHIWFATDMKADIISPFAGLLRGRCRFDRHDANEKARARYRAVVDYHVDGRAPVICDKLPLNTFRVDYVEAIHPNSKFIHLNRSPRAVARSIEQCVKRDGIWWGFNDVKWRAIRRYAETRPELRKLIPLAVDDYYRGLIEWRISQDLARDDLSNIHPDQYCEIDYDDFIANPAEVLEQAFAFIGLPVDQDAIDFAKARVAPTGSADEDQQRRSIEDDRRHALILGEDYHGGGKEKPREASFIDPVSAPKRQEPNEKQQANEKQQGADAG